MKIILNNICHSYNDKKIINNFSYIFEDNLIYSIMGESGCGKTHILKFISGLLKPTSGEIYYIENNIKKFIKNTNADIFMMHQNYTNFPWKTALKNVLFPLKIQGKNESLFTLEALNLLDLVGLKNSEYKYPAELSGGQRQRLALARVLISKPKVILMDEPLSALDEVTRKKMQELVINFQKETKCIIIIVTHDKKEAEFMSTKEIIKIEKLKGC